jgi:hypothetical protein
VPSAQKIIQQIIVLPFLDYRLSIKVLMSQVIPMLLKDLGNRDLPTTIRNHLHPFQITFHTHNNNTILQTGQLGLSKLRQTNLGNRDGGANLMGILLLLYQCLNTHTLNLLLTYNNFFLVMYHPLYLRFLNMPSNSEN